MEKKMFIRNQRKAILIATLVYLGIILITGTLAQENINDKLNKISGDTYAILHNDFDLQNQRHIYVENASKEENIFVRIRLQEFLDLSSSEDRIVEESNWVTHISESIHLDNEMNNQGDYEFHLQFNWVMGGQKYYLPSNELESGVAENDLNDYHPEKANHTKLSQTEKQRIKQTMFAEIITMDEYFQLSGNKERLEYIGWVFDNDGWIYWSQPLEAKEATGLLLQAIVPKKEIRKNNYFYAINVVMEAVDIIDLNMWMEVDEKNKELGLPSVVDGRQTELGSENAIKMFALIIKNH